MSTNIVDVVLQSKILAGAAIVLFSDMFLSGMQLIKINSL